MSSRAAAVVVACATAACGRFGFDPTPGDGADAGTASDDSAGADARPPGVQWINRLVSDGMSLRGDLARGPGGGRTAFARFTTNVAIETDNQAMALFAPNEFMATVINQFASDGARGSTSLFAAEFGCDLRGATTHPTLGLVLHGLTVGAGDGSLGACDVAVPRQSPIVLTVDGTGTAGNAHKWDAAGGNGQGWEIALLPGGAVALHGIYGGSVGFPVPLPPVPSNGEGAYLARIDPSTGVVADSLGLVGNAADTLVTPGPIATTPSGELCMLGAYEGDVTVFGMPLSANGQFDAFIARLAPSGSLRYVVPIVGPASESSFGNGAILATDAACVAAVQIGSTATVGGKSVGGRGGTDVALIVIDNAGTVESALTVDGAGNDDVGDLLALGDRWFVALDYTGLVNVAGQTLNPSDADAAVLEFDATQLVSVALELSGAGSQTFPKLGHIDDATLGVGVHSTGPLDIEGQAFDSTLQTFVLTALGL